MKQGVSFHDYKPRTITLHDAVVRGLSRSNKAIPPKYFYDERGSQLFECICRQPEYYPPTVEKEILIESAEEIASLTGPGRVLIEPGAGSAAKIRLLLDPLRPSAFVPMDISFDFLKGAATELAEEYPWLPVYATCVDYTHSLPIPDDVPDDPRLLFFPGSSIGNFERSDALAFLRMIHEAVGNGGMLLIGVDTKKCEQTLHDAYNDEAGITAQFNLNLLHRMREELGMEVTPNDFDHKAFYNSEAGRIEMHLVSKKHQTLRLNGYHFELKPGETVHTENSYKYTPEEFEALATESGFRKLRLWLGEDGMFATFLLAAII